MRILILSNYTRSLITFRGDLIRDMIARGHEVHACAPEPDEDGAIKTLGVRFHHLPMKRMGTNPIADTGLMKKYENLIRNISPDMLFCFTVKPNVYGGPAGRKAGVRYIVLMVEGLGNIFMQVGGIKRKLLRGLVTILYRRTASKSDCVIFLNQDDRQEFIEKKIVKREKTALIDGIGVNMNYYTPAPFPEKPVFLMVSRLLREKGVMVYLEAASIVKREFPHARMLLVGPYELSRFALTEEDLRPYLQSGIVEYFGEQRDVRSFYAQASVFVLPTSYREGLPRTILEAMACKRAVITTDMPGCRGTVIPDRTGLLIPPGEVQALADAMKRLIKDPEEAWRMGCEGYDRCEKKYEISKINARIFKLLKL